MEDIITGAEKCLEHGFTPVVNFIFGLPDETQEDQRERVKVIKWLTGKGARIHSHHFMSLPGTAFENAEPAPLHREVEKLMGGLPYMGKRRESGFEGTTRCLKNHEIFFWRQ